MTVGAWLGAKARGRHSRRGNRDGDDRVSILPGEEEEAAEGNAGARASAPRAAAREEEEGAAGRRVRFALLPEPYEPLRPPGKRPPARRLKKYGKNVGKALRKGCRYLVVGLQGLATAYSAPFGVAAQVASFVR